MGNTTEISWTDATWNPWRGCHKVSAGCANCYMFPGQRQYGLDPAQVIRAARGTFRAPLSKMWQTGRKIFTCSWSDFFIAEADPWRAEAWDVIRQTPQHTYQVLTKRPERIAANLPADWGAGWPHVWLGVTAEDQKTAERRLPILREIPAAVRFVSCEPMLEPMRPDLAGLAWVICGGESGPNRRPFAKPWAAYLRQQCRAAGVAFYFKQGSGLRPGQDDILDGVQVREWPAIIRGALQA